MCTHTWACTHTRTCTHRDVHTHMDVHTQRRAHTQGCAHTHRCAHTQGCAHTGMCTHMEMHTQTCTHAVVRVLGAPSPGSTVSLKTRVSHSPCYPAFSTRSILLGVGRGLASRSPGQGSCFTPMKGRTWGPLPARSFTAGTWELVTAPLRGGGHSLPRPQAPCLTAFQGGTLLLALGPLSLDSDRSPRLTLERTARKVSPVLGTSRSLADHFLRNALAPTPLQIRVPQVWGRAALPKSGHLMSPVMWGL